MSEFPDKHNMDRAANEVDEQFVSLLSFAETADAWLKETKQDPAASEKEIVSAKIKKLEADRVLDEFKAEHGLRPPIEPYELVPITEMGLDPKDKQDAEIYYQSYGRRERAELLLTKRYLELQLADQDITYEEHDARLQEIYDKIEELRPPEA